jgi:hypothetical protein
MFPRDMVCLRNISVDTLHKGDTEDDDDKHKSFLVYNSFYTIEEFLNFE